MIIKEFIRRSTGKSYPSIRWDAVKIQQNEDGIEEIVGFPVAIMLPEKKKVGIFIADAIELSDGTKEVRIGWSCCNFSNKINEPDIFNVIEGQDIAFKRMMLTEDVANFPPSIRKDIIRFVERCRRYFKDIHIIDWANNLA